jgi:hypothetical protein
LSLSSHFPEKVLSHHLGKYNRILLAPFTDDDLTAGKEVKGNELNSNHSMIIPMRAGRRE